ncbi:MAG: Asp23/Gls24 family envelope stress response protein [Anaerolineales bacterium]
MTETRSTGKTTLTPEVLLTIARMAALEVEGVKSMAPIKGGVNSLFGRGHEGVRMMVEDNVVLVDLYLVLESDLNIREVSRTVQQTVARAIVEMTGLEVGHVNIHIEDIDYNVEE